MNNKKIISVVLAVIVVAAIVGGYYFPKFNSAGIAGSSATGSTFNTAKTAAIVMNLATAGANATSSSILNSDSNDRFVTGVRVGCNGVGTSKTAYTGTGLAALTLTVGTSTTAAPATFVGFANVMSAFTLGTSTPVLVVASSTLQTATSSLAAFWPANSYMTFTVNATNTAVCTMGVDYLAN